MSMNSQPASLGENLGSTVEFELGQQVKVVRSDGTIDEHWSAAMHDVDSGSWLVTKTVVGKTVEDGRRKEKWVPEAELRVWQNDGTSGSAESPRRMRNILDLIDDKFVVVRSDGTREMGWKVEAIKRLPPKKHGEPAINHVTISKAPPLGSDGEKKEKGSTKTVPVSELLEWQRESDPGTTSPAEVLPIRGSVLLVGVAAVAASAHSEMQSSDSAETRDVSGSSLPIEPDSENGYDDPTRRMSPQQLGVYMDRLGRAYDLLGVQGSPTPEQARLADEEALRFLKG